MRHDRKGFTLLEVLAATAIISLLAYGGAMTVSRIILGTQRANDQMTALQQVQNAGYWMSRDLITSQNIAPGDDPNTPQTEFLSLYWTDWESAQTHGIYYYYVSASGGLNSIKRRVVILDSNSAVVSDTSQLIAQNIVSPVTLSQSGNIWKVNVAARSNQHTETREYDVLPRPNA